MFLLALYENGHVLAGVSLLRRNKVDSLVESLGVVVTNKPINVTLGLEEVRVSVLNVDTLVFDGFVKHLDLSIAFRMSNSNATMFNAETAEQCLEALRCQLHTVVAD